MQIAATVVSSAAHHEATVRTGQTIRSLPVAPKEGGFGSSVNAGEFLMLALAACYCNDLYREAERGKRMPSPRSTTPSDRAFPCAWFKEMDEGRVDGKRAPTDARGLSIRPAKQFRWVQRTGPTE